MAGCCFHVAIILYILSKKQKQIKLQIDHV